MTELTDTERETLIEAIQAGTEVEFVEAILTARLARVEALADEAERIHEIHDRTHRLKPDHRPCESFARVKFARRVAAALAAPTPPEVQP